ncbi:MAG: hypothetical protein AAF637_07970 [Pseudomonadota bacterium]
MAKPEIRDEPVPAKAEVVTPSAVMAPEPADAQSFAPAVEVGTPEAPKAEPVATPEPTAMAPSAKPKAAKPATLPTAGPVRPRPEATVAATLPGITMRLWQEQLARTMTAGKAIVLCRSPEDAVRLQLGYMRESVASGFDGVSEVSQWTRDAVGNALKLPPR